MPYIPKEDRPEIDKNIEPLAEVVKKGAGKYGGDYEGILNYTITKLVLLVLPERRYKHVARITGVLENVKQEFYRRFAAKYEDEQIEKNGDVY